MAQCLKYIGLVMLTILILWYFIGWFPFDVYSQFERARQKLILAKQEYNQAAEQHTACNQQIFDNRFLRQEILDLKSDFELLAIFKDYTIIKQHKRRIKQIEDYLDSKLATACFPPKIKVYDKLIDALDNYNRALAALKEVH